MGARLGKNMGGIREKAVGKDLGAPTTLPFPSLAGSAA